MAKKVDYSVEDRLRALYDLQLIDSRIDKLRSVRGELPLEVQDLEDEVSGLEVKTQDGKWITGEYIPNAICVNSGDFMKKWTNGRFIATPHRVLPPKQERYISAFFFNPNWDVTSSPLPGCHDEQNPSKYEITTFYEHLCNYVDRNYSISSGGKALNS